jgi:hypothetical protein
VRRRGAMATGVVKGTRGGDFVRTPTSGGEMDREGAGRGHAMRMGMPVHGAYVHLGI